MGISAQQILELSGPDRNALLAQDAEDLMIGMPLRFAWPVDLAFTPDEAEGWDRLPDGRHRWRLRLVVPGALSLNAGFRQFRLPWGGRMTFTSEAGPERVFTAADNRDDGELWTPIVLGDEALLTLYLPVGYRDDFALELQRVGLGYRFFGEDRADKAGWCNIDVVCPEGDDWREEIRSVAVYTRGGTWRCSGVMVNNTAQDGTPYFLTAHHCGVTSSNAASVVVYWNFESPVCGQQSGGSLAQVTSGTIFRASYNPSDVCLLELSSLPDPAWNVTYSGWDRSSADPTSAVAIHHPQCDEKSISFEYEPTTTTSYLGSVSPGDGTHIRVADWDVGTTEPGSSGSPLYNQNKHIVGQLHGGYAACDNNLPDWYGRLSVSWTGGGTNATRLSNWLDPLGTAPITLELFDPNAAPPLVLDDLAVQAGPFEALLTWTTAEPVRARADFGETTALERGSVEGEGYDTRHALLIAGLAPDRSYYYRIEITDQENQSARTAIAELRTAPLPGGSRAVILPIEPNPSRDPLQIRYALVRRGHARLAVYDLRGRLVEVLADGVQEEGLHAVFWEAARVGPGVYFCRLTALKETVVAPLTRLR